MSQNEGTHETLERELEHAWGRIAEMERELARCSNEHGKSSVEEALRQSEAKYRSIFENANEGIFQTTPDGRYLLANVLNGDGGEVAHYLRKQTRPLVLAVFRRLAKRPGIPSPSPTTTSSSPASSTGAS